jgi:DNA-binding MarR family transcriptional regulator
VKIAADKADKRSRRLTITAAGRALLSKAYPVWRQAHADTERLITGISSDAMRSALRALS